MTNARLERLVHALNLLETAYTCLFAEPDNDNEVDAAELIQHAKRAIMRAMKEGTP